MCIIVNGDDRQVWVSQKGWQQLCCWSIILYPIYFDVGRKGGRKFVTEGKIKPPRYVDFNNFRQQGLMSQFVDCSLDEVCSLEMGKEKVIYLWAYRHLSIDGIMIII